MFRSQKRRESVGDNRNRFNVPPIHQVHPVDMNSRLQVLQFRLNVLILIALSIEGSDSNWTARLGLNGSTNNSSRVLFNSIIKSLVLAFVRYIGDEVEARSYSYSLEVGGNGRKLIWEGTPRSIREHSIHIYYL
ncbi:hypothetical protein L1887_00142 [Cichorium endivia]|nr:hypothetical protein L1887_00142 [Cichorium endivia]